MSLFFYLRELKLKCSGYHFEKIYEFFYCNRASSLSIQTTVLSNAASSVEFGQLDIPQVPFPTDMPMPNENSKT